MLRAVESIKSIPLLGSRFARGAVPAGLTADQAQTRQRIIESDSADVWEEASCLCGGSAGMLVSEIDRYGLPYRKLLCPACGLLRVSPRWKAERYARFYEHDYRTLYTPMSKERFYAATIRNGNCEKIANWVTEIGAKSFPERKSLRVVEVGAGGGWNLALMPPDWSRIGFDVDEEFLAIGRREGCVDMRRGFLDEAIASEAFRQADMILLSHVVEHFSDPLEALKKLRGAMHPSALLLVEVPGIFIIHRRLYDPMRYLQNAHIFSFSAATLGALCERAGLQVLELDETARAVCGASMAGPGPIRSTDPSLAKVVARYLSGCERSAWVQRKARRLPFGVGRVSAAAVRKLWYFAAEALLVPSASKKGS